MGRREGGMDGRARVFFFFFLFLRTCFFALIDRKWLGRNCYLLLAVLVTCHLSLVPVIAQRIDAENENEKNKKKRKNSNVTIRSFLFSLVKI